MGTVIFLLLLFFIIIPLCRILWHGWIFHRRWKDATAGMRDAFERAARQAYEREQAEQQPEPKKKKIDASVGEYVNFEEISSETAFVNEDDSNQTVTDFRAESQVEDAVWEEIK